MSTTTHDTLTHQLRALGVQPGNVVMVHASMRAVGPVEGGAAGLIAALESVVGPIGTLVMNLGAQDDFAWVNAHPPEDRFALLADAPAFDKDTTAADPDVGVLAEVFRCLPGTVVNDHPDARFGARGHLAQTLLAEPLPWDNYYGPGSILERLDNAQAKVLRLGANLDTVTMLHLAEYRAHLTRKRRVDRHHKIRTSNGDSVIRAVSCLDDSDGIAYWDGEDYFAAIVREYLDLGAARLGTVGQSRAELVDAADLVRFGTGWMTGNLEPDYA